MKEVFPVILRGGKVDRRNKKEVQTRLGRLIYSMDVSRSLNVPLAACLPVFYQCSTKHGTHKGTLADKLPVAQRLIPLMLQDVHNLPSRVQKLSESQTRYARSHDHH